MVRASLGERETESERERQRQSEREIERKALIDGPCDIAVYWWQSVGII